MYFILERENPKDCCSLNVKSVFDNPLIFHIHEVGYIQLGYFFKKRSEKD